MTTGYMTAPGETQNFVTVPGDGGPISRNPLPIKTQPVHVGSGAGAPATPGANGSTGNTLSPGYLSQLFPNGIPQAPSPQQVNVDTSSTGITNAIMSSLQPLFQQQQLGLTQNLANAGIVGGSTAGAETDLANNQNTQAVGQIAPYIMQGMGLNLQQGEFNSNMGAANTQYNIDNAIKSAMYDTGNYNQFLSQQIGNQNNDWLAQLQAQTALNQQGMSGQTSSFQPVFTQPTPVNFSGLGSALAPTPTTGAGNGYYYGDNPATTSVDQQYGGF